MSEKFFAEALYGLGYTDLVSVIPPGVQLVPTSKINASQLGKVPGRKTGNGPWAGYGWVKHETSLEDVKQWCIDGANIGLRADRFPGVDIDCTDASLAKIIADVAVARLGPAPSRVGRAPKNLLMYRTAEPFGRMRLWVGEHLVEILGAGQQYLICGTHPTTLRPYDWSHDLTRVPPRNLAEITRATASAFLDELESTLGAIGYTGLERESDGRVRSGETDQGGLLAPSIDLVREAVTLIPNTTDLFPTRTDYLRMAYAIRAAGGDDPDDAFNIFAEWASRWEGNGRVAGNDPGVVLADWRRVKPPYSVGWNFLAEQARGFGFDTATLDFEPVPGAKPKPDEAQAEAPTYSDQWLADEVVRRRRGVLRFVPQKGCWLCWDGARWVIDAELLAEDIIKRELRNLALEVIVRGVTPAEKKANLAVATAMCSAHKAAAVGQLIRSDRNVAVGLESLDQGEWILNTPGGIVDLVQGVLGAADPDALCTKSTAVPPDFSGQCPEWRRFLAESTQGDVELEAYLQRLAGYCLTGSTREQQFTFIWGGGGNGKGVFLGVLKGVMGDYVRTASMDTFTANYGDRHTTELAMLYGARLVTASETQAGKRWDEAKVKLLTGGDPVTARFMRQDNFTFGPQFKLVFIGNHKPEIRDVGAAMRRRIQMVPFDVKPAQVDVNLSAKLRAEWPAILAWAIEGCLAWQQVGLKPPMGVRVATDEYFEAEDAVGRWMEECCEVDADATTTTTELFQSWREWANAGGEPPGTLKRLAMTLIGRKVERWLHPTTRRKGFKGIKVVHRQDLSIC